MSANKLGVSGLKVDKNSTAGENTTQWDYEGYMGSKSGNEFKGKLQLEKGTWEIDKQETCGMDGVKHEECTVCQCSGAFRTDKHKRSPGQLPELYERSKRAELQEHYIPMHKRCDERTSDGGCDRCIYNRSNCMDVEEPGLCDRCIFLLRERGRDGRIPQIL